MMNFLSLKLLIFSPIVAAIIIVSPLFGSNAVYIRRFSKTFAVCHFMYSMLFVAGFNMGVESFYDEFTVFGKGWLSSLGINAAFGLDGLSVLLIAFTSFIFLAALVLSKTMIRVKHKLYYTLVFLLMSAVLGVFCAKDMFLFLVFWEAELIPMYFLISQWGSGDSKRSAMKFILYTFFGSIFMFAAMLALYYYGYASNGVLSGSIDFLRVSATDEVCPLYVQILMFLGFFIGFAVKLPIIPFHTWLPDAHTDAPTPVSMLLAAILLKMGAYGLIRFNLNLFPEIFKLFAPIIMCLAVINIIWAAFVAFKQTDIKRIIAYSSISHMGIFLLGIASLTKAGFDAAFFQIFAHGFTSAGLFLVAGLVYQICKTRNIYELGGLGKSMPLLMMASYLICFAGMGIPLTIGFPAEFLAFVGGFCADYADNLPKILSLIAVSSVIFSASYILKLFHGIFCSCGPIYKMKLHDISGHRCMVVSVICFVIVLFGVFPDLLMNFWDSITASLIDILRMV